MSAVLLTEIADELEAGGMDEYAERLRFWDGQLDKAAEMVNAPDMARHILDALDKPADVPETATEQAAITAAITGWFAPSTSGGTN